MESPQELVGSLILLVSVKMKGGITFTCLPTLTPFPERRLNLTLQLKLVKEAQTNNRAWFPVGNRVIVSILVQTKLRVTGVKVRSIRFFDLFRKETRDKKTSLITIKKNNLK